MDADSYTVIVITEQDALSLEDLVEACGAEAAWIIELVEIGVLSPLGEDPAAWRFAAADLLRARRHARLSRDFGASLEAGALILDLLDEIERLHVRLRRAGMDPP